MAAVFMTTSFPKYLLVYGTVILINRKFAGLVLVGKVVP